MLGPLGLYLAVAVKKQKNEGCNIQVNTEGFKLTAVVTLFAGLHLGGHVTMFPKEGTGR